MMIKLSPLELRDLAVIRIECSFVPPTIKGTLDPQELFRSYQPDFNFAIKVESPNVYSIFVKASINQTTSSSNKALAGYKMFIECYGVFELKDANKIPETETQTLLTNSALVITINFLRTQLASYTSVFPLGKYLLPSIDMKDLFDKKNESIKKEKTK